MSREVASRRFRSGELRRTELQYVALIQTGDGHRAGCCFRLRRNRHFQDVSADLSQRVTRLILLIPCCEKINLGCALGVNLKSTGDVTHCAARELEHVERRRRRWKGGLGWPLR